MTKCDLTEASGKADSAEALSPPGSRVLLTSQPSMPRVVLGLGEGAVSALLSWHHASHRQVPLNAPNSIQGHCEHGRNRQ